MSSLGPIPERREIHKMTACLWTTLLPCLIFGTLAQPKALHMHLAFLGLIQVIVKHNRIKQDGVRESEETQLDSLKRNLEYAICTLSLIHI